ncbi:MAG TPA: glycoside hydrolase family 30 beta sandwich domain-containing protein [Saprospiraceae bacterium]|nr:glycoside hydrolase family 30 beta sandwich domain-containing protein [Saprospiraceae bacterium]
MKHRIPLHIFICLLIGLMACNCSNPDDPSDPGTPKVLPVGVWTTSGNQVNLLYHKTIDFATAEDTRFPVLDIKTTETFQTMDGFGYSLTGGSAILLHQMNATARAAILKELFGKDSADISVSYLRISIGASDLDPVVFSYDDLPNGITKDLTLQYFSLSRDTTALIPVLKEILSINPSIKIMGSPWSAPTWMKSNNNSVGGNLKPEYYSVYADYFVKYIQAMRNEGITIDAITPQNEPQHGGNNPSLVMSAAQQGDFIKNHLGPKLQAAGLNTKIVIWDHNCDRPDYPIEILNDASAKQYVQGSAFHLYNGDVSALSAVHDAHPDRALYFTEQWTGSTSTFDGDLEWHIKNVIIGTARNWSQVALEWNLASDPQFNPHTPGGCTQCKGAITIDGSNVTRNVAYYIIAHASKFVPAGSVRINSTNPGAISNVAFKTPEGKTVLIALNEGNDIQSFNIHAGDKWITASLHSNTAGTFVW